MRSNRLLEAVRKMVNGRKQDLEISEELTNAYFGNWEAWQIENNTQARPEIGQKEPE